MEERKGRRVVLFPLPFQGHIRPMIQLGNLLHTRGFSITVVHTTFNSPDPSLHPHIRFHFLHENILSQSQTDIVAFLKVLNANCLQPLTDCLARLISDDHESPISCLISDAGFTFTGEAARQLKLPRLVLRTSGSTSFSVFAAFPFLREKGYLPIQESRLEEQVAEFPHLKVKDLPVIKTNNPEDLFELVNGMIDGTKSSAGVIFNTFQELEDPAITAISQDFQVPIFPIGPFHKLLPSSPPTQPDQTAAIDWLDKQAASSVIYVSFGTLAALNEQDFVEIAWGLANSKQPFLWVVRPGLINGSDWLDLLPKGLIGDLRERGLIVKWAPQHQILAHRSVAVFWTHNGWNSTLESVCEGVPMICMPFFTDQKVNARYVRDVWRVGLGFESGKLIEREEIERVIRGAMVGEEGKEIRKRVLEWKEKARVCLGENNGSSFQSLERLVSHILSFDSLVFSSQ
ncbi:UDP-glycosyltransferase 76F1-like [Carica papaya]|uniref:UDP-glycosyltransferase 76F1-like n=1 Tax=Carica papaya TaxID=3649 RepID=UPI000B8C9C08|nr:UDP-glycosyltransferase 76F1-like [Carica papaya]